MAAKAFDEMNSGATGSGPGGPVRAPYRGVADWLARKNLPEAANRDWAIASARAVGWAVRDMV